MQVAIIKTKNIFDLLYTNSRTEEILKVKGVKVVSIENIRIKNIKGNFLCCIQTTYRTIKGRCSTFLSCWDYLKHFVLDRKLRSRHYIAIQNQQNPTIWQVSCPSEPSKPVRTVRLYPEQVTCTCEDFANQIATFKEHPYLSKILDKKLNLCKHSIATLNTIGIRNYQGYFTQWEPGGRFHSLSQG